MFNRCTGIYKFGNNTYPRRIRHRLNLGNIFWEKSASYGPGNTVYYVLQLTSFTVLTADMITLFTKQFCLKFMNFIHFSIEKCVILYWFGTYVRS